MSVYDCTMRLLGRHNPPFLPLFSPSHAIGIHSLTPPERSLSPLFISIVLSPLSIAIPTFFLFVGTLPFSRRWCFPWLWLIGLELSAHCHTGPEQLAVSPPLFFKSPPFHVHAIRALPLSSAPLLDPSFPNEKALCICFLYFMYLLPSSPSPSESSLSPMNPIFSFQKAFPDVGYPFSFLIRSDPNECIPNVSPPFPSSFPLTGTLLPFRLNSPGFSVFMGVHFRSFPLIQIPPFCRKSPLTQHNNASTIPSLVIPNLLRIGPLLPSTPLLRVSPSSLFSDTGLRVNLP